MTVVVAVPAKVVRTLIPAGVTARVLMSQPGTTQEAIAGTRALPVVVKMVHAMVQAAAVLTVREPCAKTIVAMGTANNLIHIAMAVLASRQVRPVVVITLARVALVATIVPTTVIAPVPPDVQTGHVR